MTPAGAEELLGGAWIDPAVAALRPDYRVLLVLADGLVGGPGGPGGPGDPGGPDDQVSEELLTRAEAFAAQALDQTPVTERPHVAAWREAYAAFGAKPQRTRNSLEALTRRAAGGLPRVNRLTDVYNAISVLHQVPLGGEDAAAYDGPPRLLRASGTESFDTTADGAPVVEHPEPGEVVWADGTGVTCRRWNWRQGHRTRLREETGTALFILDALAPCDDVALGAAGDALVAELERLGPDVRTARRLLAATP